MFNYNSYFLFWMLLELNMVIFIAICFFTCPSYLKMNLHDFSLVYFVFQTMGSLTFLNFVCFSTCKDLELVLLLAIVGLSVKSALFPFFGWLYDSLSTLNSLTLGLVLSSQKIPLFLFLFSQPGPLTFLILFLTLISGSLSMNFSENWKDLLFFSSLYSVFWIYFMFQMSIFSFFLFFFLYTLLNISFCLHYSHNRSMSPYYLGLNFGFFIMFVGLPPLSFFFFKYFFIQFLFYNFDFFLFLIIWIFIFMAVINYSKFLFHFFFSPSVVYNLGSFKFFSTFSLFFYATGAFFLTAF